MNMVRMVRIVGFCLVSVFMATSAQAVTGYWTNNNTANWDTSGSWVDGIIPNGAGDIAYFTHNFPTSRAVNIVGSVTNGMIYVGDADGSHAFSISGSTGTNVFDNAGSSAALTMTATSSNLTVNTGRVVLESDLTITNLSAASLMTISSIIEGTGSVSVAGGPGVLLSASNSFGGGITLNSGLLRFGNNYAMGPGPMTFLGGTVDVLATRTTPNNNPQIWGGDFGFVGTWPWDTGRGDVTLTESRTVSVGAGSYALTVGGAIDDGVNTYSLTKAGVGALALAGTNTYGGGTVINAGELSLNSPYALGSGTLTINGGAINATAANVSNANNNAQVWNGNFGYPARYNLHLGTGGVALNASIIITNPSSSSYSSALTVGGSIDDGANSYSLTFSGTNGVLVLAGSNTYDGGTVLNGGTLRIQHARALGPGPFTINGGEIDNWSGSQVTNENNNVQYWNGNFSCWGHASLLMGTGTVTLGANITVSNNYNELRESGAIGDGGNGYRLTKAGGGLLMLEGDSTFSGGVTLRQGELGVQNNGALGTGVLTINGGQLVNGVSGITNKHNNVQVWNASFAYRGISGRSLDLGTGAVTLGSSLVVTSTLGALTVGGPIGDGGSGYGITKVGGNTLFLSGVSTYSGDTTVLTGTLALAGSGSIANSSTITVHALATLSVSGRTDRTLTLGSLQTLRGNGAVVGVVTNLGVVAPGLSAGRFGVTGTYSQVGSLEIELGGTTPISEHDVLAVTGAATLGGLLKVTTIDGFTPVVGNAFTVLTASAVSASFATTNLPAGLWTVDYLANAVVLTYTGEGGGAVLGVLPSALNFSSVRVGESADLAFTVTNSGSAQLEGTATVSGVGFAVQSGSPFSVAAGTAADVTIRFAPTETASYLGDVVFLSNGGGSTNAVSGVGYVQTIGTNTAMSLVGGQPTFSFTLVSGALYRVQASTNLLDGSAWQDVTGYLTNNYLGGSVPAFSETNAAIYPRRSYRVSSP